MSDRKTVSLSQGAYDALDAEKREDESFSDVVLRVCTESDDDDAPSPEEFDLAAELPGGVLTIDHLDDIAARTARQTADEVENRLSRR